MRRTRGRAAAVAGCAAVLAAGAVLVGLPGIARAASTATVPGSATPGVGAASRAGAVPAAQPLAIQMWLQPDLATGPVSKVQSAFGVRINRYRVMGPNG